MAKKVADAIKAIRLFAETTGDELVYAKAEIPPPAPRTPALLATKPVDVSFKIEPTGALTVCWSNAASTTGYDASTANVIYTVRRQINSQAAFAIIGAVPAVCSGRRGITMFTDDSLSRNAANIQYLIVPQRGTLTGPMSEVYSVSLGVGVDGNPGLNVTREKAGSGVTIKMAA